MSMQPKGPVALEGKDGQGGEASAAQCRAQRFVRGILAMAEREYDPTIRRENAGNLGKDRLETRLELGRGVFGRGDGQARGRPSRGREHTEIA